MAQINFLLGSSRDTVPVKLGTGRLVLVVSDGDPGHLAGVERICVLGFTITGDEGGTWTSYRALDLVDEHKYGD